MGNQWLLSHLFRLLRVEGADENVISDFIRGVFDGFIVDAKVIFHFLTLNQIIE